MEEMDGVLQTWLHGNFLLLRVFRAVNRRGTKGLSPDHCKFDVLGRKLSIIHLVEGKWTDAQPKSILANTSIGFSSKHACVQSLNPQATDASSASNFPISPSAP
ncbi:hypothetical protein GOP47_0010798 [Adiantum capillus-veneris]|uniref:Uncharacterized protein n=1 Tax=Adiantum capillus-veneris TaxID=13818 RepID=A0A9D4UW07_ADICA|nr:hypothetical protein GOP47_0010798 [Adiantum capillus-veneris]